MKLNVRKEMVKMRREQNIFWLLKVYVTSWLFNEMKFEFGGKSKGQKCASYDAMAKCSEFYLYVWFDGGKLIFIVCVCFFSRSEHFADHCKTNEHDPLNTHT